MTKRLLLIVWIITSLGSLSFSQADTAPNAASDNLYSKALFASLAKMAEAWGHINSADKNTLRADYHHMIVEAYPEITDTLPTQFGDYHVRYLDAKDLVGTYKSLRK